MRVLDLVGRDGFEPSKPEATDLQSVAFDHSATFPYRQFILFQGLPTSLKQMELVIGVEPTTC